MPFWASQIDASITQIPSIEIADPETQRAYFWYLMTMDLSDFNPYAYPESSLMQEMRAEADAATSEVAVVEEWFDAWSTGHWWPAPDAGASSSDSPVPSNSYLRDQFPSMNLERPPGPYAYQYQKFYKCPDLLACFRLYTPDGDAPPPESMTEKSFYDHLSRLAKSKPHLLKRTSVKHNSVRGYTVLRKQDPSTGSPAPIS